MEAECDGARHLYASFKNTKQKTRPTEKKVLYSYQWIHKFPHNQRHYFPTRALCSLLTLSFTSAPSLCPCPGVCHTLSRQCHAVQAASLTTDHGVGRCTSHQGGKTRVQAASHPHKHTFDATVHCARVRCAPSDPGSTPTSTGNTGNLA